MPSLRASYSSRNGSLAMYPCDKMFSARCRSRMIRHVLSLNAKVQSCRSSTRQQFRHTRIHDAFHRCLS
jgi:hypothetical protein